MMINIRLDKIFTGFQSMIKQMRWLDLFWILAIVMMFLYTPALADFSDNFESGNLSNWGIDGSDIVEITTNTSAEGTRSFHLYDSSSSSHSDGIHATIPDFQPGYVSFYVKPGSTSASDGYFILKDSSCGWVIYFYANSDGTFELYPSNSSVTYNSNQWYHIEFKHFDWISHTFDYYVDSNLIQSVCSFRDSCSKINYIELYNFSPGINTYWDDIQVLSSSSGNEPPIIQPIDDQSAIGQHMITLNITDPENDTLIVSADSSDESIVPNENLLISGSGSNWTLTITPANNQAGTTTITVYVDDANNNPVSTSFVFRSIPVFELPENSEALPGSSLSIPLTLNNPENTLIYGLEATINYQSDILQATGVTLTGTVLENDYIIVHNLQNSGQIIICYAANTTVYNGDGIIAYLNFDVIGGSGESSSLTFVTAKQNETMVRSKNGGFVVQVNQPPSISNIASVSGNEDEIISVSFTANDIESDPCELVIDVTSSNTTMLPDNNIAVACNNNSYNMNLYPVTNKNGTSTIEITATDASGLFDTQSFTVEVLAVNDSPTIEPIASQSIDEDVSTNAIHFTISDIETTANSLELSAESSDIGLIPVENIIFGGSEQNRSLTITPSENLNGMATITITVFDGYLSDSTIFDLTVTAVDDPPKVNYSISDISANEDDANQTIDLSTVFSDIDNDDSAIIKSVTSNTNSTIVSTDISNNILTLDYLDNQSGTADISITAESNGKTVVETFTIHITPVDDPPEIATPIDDIVANEDAQEVMIDLSSVFNDIDNDNAAMIKTIQNNNTDLIQTNLSGDTLTLTYLPDQSGSATITVSATSNEIEVLDTFTVTVNPVDDQPEILTPISNVVVDEDASDTIIDLSSVFTDRDNDDASIVIQLQSNDNQTLVTTNLSNNNLTLSYLTDQNGIANLSIQASSNGLTVIEMFTITVNPIDDNPDVANEITDVTVDEDNDHYTIDLSNVFTDRDNVDENIVKTIITNTNPSLVHASINSNNLILDFQPDQNGSTVITVQGESNGLTVSDHFLITVNAVDDLPEVSIPINDVVVNEDELETIIDLSSVFTDKDNDIESITKTIGNNTNESLVSATINDNSLILSYSANNSGSSTITIEALSNGKSINDTFTVTVNPIDDPPYVISKIEDLSLIEDASEMIIPLTNVFADIDSNNDAIIKTIYQNTNEDLLNVSITDNMLNISLNNEESGTAIVSIMADSNGLTVVDVFTVDVSAEDDPPEVVYSIQNLVIDEDAADTVIDLSDIFTDVDNDDNAIVKTIQSNSNSSLVVASIRLNTLTLSYAENQSGACDISILATSNGKTVTDSFSVTVNAVDDLPEVMIPIDNISVNEDSSNTIISLTNVFTDKDTDDSSIITTIAGNTNTSLVQATIIGNEISLVYQPDQHGIADISVMATSNGLTIVDQFTVTVNSVDDPPTVVTPLADITANEDDMDDTVDLSGVFTDKDNDNNAIIKTLINNNESLVTASINTNIIHLSYQPDQHGIADITIIANSNGLTTVDQFMVTVSEIDDSPEVSEPIADIEVNEDDPMKVIHLANVFTDKDNDNTAITKTLLSNTNESVVSVSISENVLTLTYVSDQHGIADISIMATSNGLTIVDQFTVTVNPIDDPPTVLTPIADITANEDDMDDTVDLSGVFTDKDNDNEGIQITIQNNSNESLVNATITNSLLTLSYQTDQHGSSEIVVLANSNGMTITESFNVNVLSMDDAPQLINEIEDIVVYENADNTIISLTDVFTDVDNDLIIITIESNTNNTLVLATITDNLLTLNYQSHMSGISMITIRGTSNGLFEEDTFMITVISTDAPPELVQPIADIAADVNASNIVIPLTHTFIDPDNDPISLVVHDNSNSNLLTATLQGNDLILSFATDQDGQADITIRATANSKYIDDTFTVFVSRTDVGPEVANPINDMVVFEDSSPSIIDLSTVFTDPDNDDQAIKKSLVSNSNESLVMAAISGNQLTLSYASDMSGTSSVVIRATSGGKFIDESILITVNPVDDPPVVQNPIDAISTIEDSSDASIALTQLFADPDNDDMQIHVTITQNTRPDLISTHLVNKTLTLHYLPDQFGNAQITIRGTSNDLFVDYVLMVMVDAVDDPPVVATPLNDLAMDATAESMLVGLTGVFKDLDNDDSAIVMVVQNNTNPSMINATIDAHNMLLTHTIGVEGIVEITIQAISNGLTVTDAFNVIINSSDLAPVLANPIEDITVTENAPASIIPLTLVFTDPDDDDAGIDKIVEHNSNEQLIQATISNNNLMIVYQPDMNGSAMITIRGISKGQYIDDDMMITVLPQDSPPEIIKPMEDVFVDEDAIDMTISLTQVFNDVDNDNNAIIYSVVENTNTTLIDASIHNNQLDIHLLPDQNGSASISIQAQSNGLTVIDQMFVTVNAIDDPPEVGTVLNDVTVYEDADDTFIDLSTAFVDVDHVLIIKTIQSNTNSSLVATSITNDTLKLSYAKNQNGSATIVVSALSNGKTATQAFQIVVTPVNDAPTAINTNISVLEDSQVSGRIQAIDSENDPITINLLTQPEHGWLTITNSSTGDFLYQPYANVWGLDTFTFNVSDHQLTSEQAEVTIEITPVNDLPEMPELPDHEIYEGASIKQSFNVKDIDSNQIIITVTSSNPMLMPYRDITFEGAQKIDSQQAVVEMTSSEMPVTMTFKPASSQSGETLIKLNIMDDSGESIERTFSIIVRKYQIVATTIGNGKIQPSGIVEVSTNTPYVFFTIQPDTGYLIDYLIVDGAIISARTMYSFWNIIEDHTITAVFREPVYYTITTQAATGGTIIPSGDVMVQDGKSQTFSIQANTGYDIDYLNVDGVYVAATSQYTFNNVNAEHMIQAFFEAIPSPIADFEASPVEGSPPLEVSFKDQSQNLITSRTWNFGDGSTSVLKDPQHTYVSPGKYTVSLAVSGPGGQDISVKNDLIVTSVLQADFTAFPASGSFPLPVTFTAQISNEVTGVQWNFGDNETSTHLNPTHTYTSPGIYSVKLIIYGLGTQLTVLKKDYIKVKGRNISGRVTASDTGKGLSGYQVEIIQRQTHLKVGETYTDGNGYYSFVCEPTALTCLTTFQQIPAASDLILGVWPPITTNDYYMQYYKEQTHEENASLISTLDSDQTDINLMLEKVSSLGISGKISNNGVPEIGIEVSGYSEELSFGLISTTDQNGVYTLTGLKASNDYRVSLWHDEQNSEIYFALPENKLPGQDIPLFSVYNWDAATLVEPKTPCLQHIDIIVDHATNKRGSIQGHVYTSENKAAEGIWVYAFSETLNTGNGAFTGLDGGYTITALPEISDTDPLTMGYIVAVHSIVNNQQDHTTSKLWYTYQAYPNVNDKLLAEHVQTGATGIDFHLKTQCTLSGKVTDIFDSPIPGAEIKVRSDITGLVVSGFTDQNGQYAITGLAPVNDYLITASAVHYPLVYYNGQSPTSKDNRVNLSDGDVDEIDFALDTGMVIQGKVFIESSDNPAPSGLWVNIWSESTQTGGDAETEQNGVYRRTGLDPTATDYIISMHKNDYMPAFYADNQDTDLMNDTVYYSNDRKGVSPTTIQWAVDRNLILRKGLSISGKVQYMGTPVSDINVEAFCEAKGAFGEDISSDTATDGYNYKINGLPPGEYYVSIQPKNYQDDSYRVELTNTDITNLYFPLRDLENKLCGTVYGLDNSKKAQITAWSEGTGFNKTILLTGTGNEIAYTIPQLKPSSDYIIKFTGRDYPMQVYNNHFNEDEADLISISEGTISGIDFHVSSGTETISGTITFPGSAIPGDIAWVDAFSPSTGSDGSVQVMLINGHTANYQITGLKEAPDFTVVAWGKQYKEQYYDKQTDISSATLINTADDIQDNNIDFDLTPGTTIAGFIFRENIPVEGIQVNAISDKTASFGGTTTASDGSYLIEGLDLSDDYIVKVQKFGMAPFYYHETSTTRDEKLATRISTIDNNHVTGIDIHMAILESISGTVRDKDGKALSGIWINVWSDLQKSGGGMYTAEDGTYHIEALPKSDDYKVSIGEHAALIYIPEEKNGVKSGSYGVDFVLRKAYQLKGTVTNVSGQAVVAAKIELTSKDENFTVPAKTDGSGTYNINCAPSASDYVLNVTAPDNVSYVPYNEIGLTIDSTTTIDNRMSKTIILRKGSFIKGFVYKNDAATPIKDAVVNVYTISENYSSMGETDENGFYHITNIPIASDYRVSITTDKYAKSVKTDQVTGTTVNFILETGATLSGKVIAEDGDLLEDVFVKVESKLAHISGSDRTDENGLFAVNGMLKYLETGQEINDYEITIFPTGYAEQSQGQKGVDEFVTFICKKGQVTGMITDSEGNPKPEGVSIGIALFNKTTQGGFIHNTEVQSDGSFTIEGLVLDKAYHLRFKIFKSKMTPNVQWINQEGIGVPGRNEAYGFESGDHINVKLSGTWDK